MVHRRRFPKTLWYPLILQVALLLPAGTGLIQSSGSLTVHLELLVVLYIRFHMALVSFYPTWKKATQGCPCGYFNHPERECTCPPGAVGKYLNKISGPLLDRIDLHVEVTPVPFSELSSKQTYEKSEVIRERVMKAREIQSERYKDSAGTYSNAQMSSNQLREICVLDGPSANLLKKAMEKLNLSARAYDRILKVSRTIADLAGEPNIRPEHVAEAIQYRSLDREGWSG